MRIFAKRTISSILSVLMLLSMMPTSIADDEWQENQPLETVDIIVDSEANSDASSADNIIGSERTDQSNPSVSDADPASTSETNAEMPIVSVIVENVNSEDTDPEADPEQESAGNLNADPAVDPDEDLTVDPNADSSVDPNEDPAVDPNEDPTVDPNTDPTVDPNADSTVDLNADPAVDPNADPAVDPNADPAVDPNADPAVDPNADPAVDPNADPAVDPNADPAVDPNTDPTVDPNADPTVDPNTDPTVDPNADPSADPNTEPDPDEPLDGEETVTVTFTAAIDGKNAVSVSIPENASILNYLPNIEEKEDFAFVGWFYHDIEIREGMTPADLLSILNEAKSNARKADDTEPVYVLNAEIRQVVFTVSFEIGKETYTEKRSITEDDQYPVIGKFPTREGFSISGWKDIDGNSVTSETEVTADITLKATIEWTVTFRNRDGEAIETRTVEDGQTIGTLPPTIEREDYFAYWAIGTATQGEQGTTYTAGEEVTASTVVNSDLDIVPGYRKITYTISFYKDSSLSELVATRTVDVDTNYCLNDIPAVPEKINYTGKWLYSEGDFTNSSAVNADTNVWAEYVKNIFTVRFLVNGETYSSDTYNTGASLVLPTEPVIEGKKFTGWFIGEQEYTGGETVTSDLEITAQFIDAYSVTFIIVKDDGSQESISQYFREAGQPIGTLPQNPFLAGKVFEKWVKQGTSEEVTANTIVDESFVAIALFRDVVVYTITAEYYYLNDSRNEVIFNTDYIEAEISDLPYTIVAPSSTQTDPNEVSGAPRYYPADPTKTISEGDFDAAHKATVRFKYVPFTAVYDFVYLLKNLNDDGYTEIDRERDVQGVLNSYVTATVKTYDYAVFESAESAIISQPSGQELVVKYTRKNFSLTYETNGGSYVGGATLPYGSAVQVSSTEPTRDGYTFAGWYKDPELTQPAGSSVTIEGNTTLYAKWTGKTVNYTIVYLFEKYNDAGTEASFVYDNSETGHGTVGDTILATASSIPDKTKKGWEKDNAQNANSSVVIAADGSSVLYVYYKLREYTFNFNAGTYSSGWSTYNVNATLVGKGVSGTGTLNYSIKVKLGQNIATAWPGNVTGHYSTGGWWPSDYDVDFNGWLNPVESTRYVTKRTIVTPEMLPSNGTTITYTAQWTNNANTYTVNYWLQNADDDNYTRSEEYSQTYTSSGGNLGAKEIPGYTYHHGNSGASNTTTYNFYYNRDTFKIDYYYGSSLLKTIENIKFDATITSNTYNWTPSSAQCSVDSDYSFAGWYSDSGLSTPYTFNKMPASNLVLYAKWTAPSYMVHYLDEDGVTELSANKTVEKYHKAEKPANPTKSGYTFDGWYTTATGSTLYDWNMQITTDTNIYAHWSRNMLSYTVRYVDEAGLSVAEDKVVSDPNFTVGQEIEELAIAVAGYRPLLPSQTLTLAETSNVITFIYSVKGLTTSYTVRYILNPNEYTDNIKVHEDKSETINGDAASIIESAAAVDYAALVAAHPELNGLEFFPDEAEKTLVLTANAEQNILTFYYSSFKYANIIVNYVDMAGVQIATPSTSKLKVGNNFTLSRTAIAGWELNKAVVGTAYAGPEAGTEYKITEAVTENGLEFTLFYQRKATITVVNRTKQYDGTALTLPAALADQVTIEGMLDGDTISGVAFNYENVDYNDIGRLNAGVATVTPKNATVSGTHASTNNYYSIRYISGTLEVTKINVTVRIEPDRWVNIPYDGMEKKAGFTNGDKTISDYIIISHDGYKSAYMNAIWDAAKAKATYDASTGGLHYYGIAKTDAGDYSYNIGLTLADLPQNQNYDVSLYVRPGRLEIKKAPLTITTGSAEKQYDGTPLTNEEVTITGLVNGETATVTATGSQTIVGTSSNTYSIEWGTTNPNNYEITENLGTLVVTGTTLTVTVKDATKAYTGSEQTANTFPATITGTGSTIETNEYIITGLGNGDTLSIEYTPAKGTNAGTYNGSFATSYTITKNGEDVSESYESASFNPGNLVITKGTVIVSITGNSSTTGYNGKVQSVEGYRVIINNPLYHESDFEFTGEAKAEGTNVDDYPMNISTDDFTNLNDNFDVTFRVADGYLKIMPIKVTIKPDDQTYTYNGSAQGCEGTYTDAYHHAHPTVSGDLKETDYLGEITLSGTETDVGVYPTASTASGAKIVNAAGEDVTANYTISYEKGKITIKKAQLTITAKDQEYVYNGEAQGPEGTYNADFDDYVTIEGLQGDDELTGITLSGSQTEPGTYTDEIVPSNAVIGSATDNYDITYIAGDLIINKAELTVEKKADPTSGVKVGDTITYTIKVTNSGNVTITEITLVDTLVTLSEVAFELAPEASKEITYTYTVTQADVDAGKIDNTVTASGKDPKGEEVSDTVSATVTTEEAKAKLTVVKTADPASEAAVGDTVTYTVVVTNSGNVTLKAGKLNDDHSDLSDKSFELAPNESATFSYTYTVTQADVDAGEIVNVVNANAEDPKGAKVHGSATATVTTEEAEPELTVKKTANPSSGVKVGDEITYTVVITNSGNITVTGIALRDSLVRIPDSDMNFSLAPGESKTITYTYTVTQADVDAGKIDNSVRAEGKAANNEQVWSEATATVTTVIPEGALKVEKTADPTSGVKVGDKITYTVIVTNSGNVTISGISMNDSLVPILEDENGFDLAPNASNTITYTYTVTQADVDAGQIDNTVTATGKDPNGKKVTGTDTATVTTEEAKAELTVEKTANPSSGVNADDTVTYTVVVTNSGNVTVSEITLDDTLVTLNEAAFELAPAETKTITYTYTVTQEDVDEGKIDNTVTATGKDPKDKEVSGSDDETVTTVEADPKLTVVKTADPTSGVEVGDTITYTVVVKNEGNVTVKEGKLADDHADLTGADQYILAPGESKSYTYTYTVTQTDVDAGKIINKVITKAKPVNGGDIVQAEATATVTTVVAEGALTVEKSANPAEGVKVGDEITYTIVVMNSGNVTITGITLADTLVTLSEAAFDLAPAGTKTITYTYTVTQTDVDAGQIDNKVTATGKDPNDGEVSGSDDATVTTIEAEPKLSIEKTADPTSGVEVGDTITYTVVVKNEGNVTVKEGKLADDHADLTGVDQYTLAPGESATYTYTYTVTQADVDAGKIINKVITKAKPVNGGDIVEAEATATVTTVEGEAKLTIKKTADPASDVAVGDTVTYTVVVTNSGNVTIKGITLEDTLVTLSEQAFDLAPAGSKTITYTYTVTQEDVDKGKIDNTATATGGDVTASDDATVTTVEAEAELTVEKKANQTSNVKVGNTITYTITVNNSGNVTITGITLDDTLVTLREAAFDLAPEDTKTITYTYTVTQADVDAGKIDNTVTATGKDPNGEEVSGEASATVTAEEAKPELKVEKTADPTSEVEVGDTVTYTVMVTNSGNVTISGIELEDTLVTLSEEAFDLAPEGTKTIIYTYTVTQADVDKGQIDNTVTATGKDPKDKDVTASDDATVTTVDAKPELKVEKTANPTNGVKAGDKITYTVVVTNIGNVTISGIAMSDTLVTIFETDTGFDLAPDASNTITYTYTVTQADVDAGKIDNTVTANGKDPKGKKVTGTDTATVTTEEAKPELNVEKTADPTSGVAVGDTITYTVVVTNSGNVTITGITLDDTLVTLNEAAFDLAPAGTKTITYTYTVTQAEVDEGNIENTITAIGKDPKDKDVTASDNVTVTTVEAKPVLTVEKIADPTTGIEVGDTVTYTVVVTNSGNVTISEIKLEDTLVDLNEAAFDLAPTGTKTIIYTYTVTQVDVDAGKIDNTAKAKGKDPKNKDVTASDDATVTTVEAKPELTVEKTADPTSGVAVGDTVTYTVVVTNSGNVTITGIEFEDTLVTLNEATFELAPAGTKTITYTYTVTQADVNEGKIDNTVTATGKDPKDKDVSASDDTAVTTEEAKPELTVEKTADPASGVEVGDTVTYTVVITNSGNVTIKEITLDDTLVTLNEAAFDLAPAGTKTITYNYEVTQADVDEGKIDNTVTATGQDPKDKDVTASDDATVTTVDAKSELKVEKTANPTNEVKVGDEITYTVVITNSGNVTITGISLEDTLVDLNESAFELAPAGTKTITYSYTVTQADVNEGKIDNTITATGKDPKGKEVKGAGTATVTTEDAKPELTVEKTADPTSEVEVNDEITYTVVVTNSGNVTIKEIELEDTLVNLNETTFELAPAGTKTITYTYTVTQTDVDAGKIDNKVTASGKDPKGEEVSGEASATVTTEEADPKLTVEKTADPASDVKVGDTITYTVVVTNSGNVTVSGITLDDTLVELSEAAFELAPAGTKTITYTYVVTQADVDEGKIDNTVTATGEDPMGNEITVSDNATVTTVEAKPELKVEKTANPTSGVKVGDTVTYSVVVTNIGNVTISGIAMSDTLVTIFESDTGFDLAPNASKTITYTYTVAQADVDAGKIDNKVTATGKDPKGEKVTGTDTATVTTETAKPELTVEKSADPASGVKVGDTVTYTVVVTNSGNVTITGITLEDTLVSPSELAFDLAPEGTKTITYTYTVTQADVDAGKIDNTATATGKAPKDKDVTASDDATVATVEATPELTVEKTADPASGVKAGDTVKYTVVVTNNGNVTISEIKLEDTLVDLNEAAFDLAPAGTKTITYTYTVTQDNVDTGKIDNTATATGKDPKDKDVTASDDATVTAVDAKPQLDVEKTADPTSGVKVGDKINYTVVVTNSGNVTITGISMSDTLVPVLETDTGFDLAPNASNTFTYTYTVTQTDIDAGKIDNTVTATGQDPKGEKVTGTDTATVTTEEAKPELTVDKTADPTSGVAVGNLVRYTVVVTNSGNVTVSGITLDDTLVTLNEAAFDLAPAGTKTITYTYTVNQADVDNGKIDNTITAIGKDTKDKDVTASDNATITTVEPKPGLTVEKTADPTTGVEVGDTVTYTVVVTNSGNVTISEIKLDDTLVTLSEAAFDLAPTGTKTITYTYTVTQTDVDAGKIDNKVTASGKDPKDKDVTASDDASVTTVEAKPELTVEKTAGPASGVKVGDTVTYTVVVTNSGNVTITGIELEDTLVTLNEAAFDLTPAGTKTITYTYTVTQSDVDEGKIDNTVTATGKDPKDKNATASDEATVTTEEAKPELTVEKTADPANGVEVGDTVTYTVVVTNSGNVTIKEITLDDTLVTLSEAEFELAPAGTKTINYTYEVTQSDVDEGKIDNTVTATGKEPKDKDVTASDDVTVTTVEPKPELTVKKTANPTSEVKVGDEITYTVVITNSGNVTITGISLEDTLVDLNEAAFDLAPADTKKITYTYTVTQADVDEGKIDNTITATGKDPKGKEVKGACTATVTTEDAKPELTVEKTADPTTGVEVGDTVPYTVVVTNSGNVTIKEIELEDTLVDLNETAFELAPAGTKTITYTYTVTQADVDEGKIDNIAKATGKDPKGNEVTASDDATVTTVDAEPELTVEKTADPTSEVKVGDTVTYSVVVTNIGNVTISGIELEDTLVELNEAAFELAPAGTKTITYTYTVTQADVDEGKIDNTVTATGKDPKDNKVTASDDATVTSVDAEPELTVEKTADPASGVKVGDEITYTVVITNSGNVTIKEIKLDDTLVTLSEAAFDLAPAGTKTITYNYTVTQADVDAGKIDNTATATGKDPKGNEVTISDNVTVNTVEPNPELTVEKTSSCTSEVKVSDEITYTVVITNSGNVTIQGIKLEDTLVDLNESAFDLAPAGTKTITYTYTVKQADVDEGKINNTATATGKDPKGNEVNGKDTATVTTEDAKPELTVEKTADPSDGVEVGDTVTYTVVVTNSGNVTVKGIELKDTLVDLNESAFDLAPAETKTITYTYDVTQADVDKGKIDNTATATGKDPKGNEVTASDDATVTTVEAKSELTVEKTADPTGNVKPGDTVTYTVVVTNSGNVTVKNGVIDDDHADLSSESFELAPGESKTVTYTYTVTQADVNAGQVVNVVKVNATAVRGDDPAESQASVTVKTIIPGSKTEPGPFSVILFGDLLLNGSEERTDAMVKMFDWANEHGAEFNAIGIMQSGGTVEKFDDEESWKAVSDKVNELRGKSSYMTVAGETDINADIANYEAFTSRNLTKLPTTQMFGNGKVWYQTLDSYNMLFVGIGYDVNEDSTEWINYVNNVISKYHNFSVVLVVNSYMTADKQLTRMGEIVEKNIVAKNSNVRLVLCGAETGAERMTKSYDGREVNVLLFSLAGNDQLGFVRTLTIDSEKKTIEIKTINAATNETLAGDQNTFTLSNAF